MATKLQPNFRAYVMAMNRVERLLMKVTRALDASGIDYCVIGGNAVAAWVSTIDPDATRTTKDVDLLVRREDLSRMEAVLSGHGFELIEVTGVWMFVSRDRPNPKTGVHLLFSNERVLDSDAHATPDMTDVVNDVARFRVIGLNGLLRLKLQAFRRMDQVHMEDLLRIGLIDAELAGGLPEDLRVRLRHVRDTMEWSTEPPAF